MYKRINIQMSTLLDKLSNSDRQRYLHLSHRKDQLNDSEYSEYLYYLDRMGVNRGGNRRSKTSQKRTTTHRRRSSKNKSRKINKHRKH